jgi:holo-[acyl-carrier protein] synthase
MTNREIEQMYAAEEPQTPRPRGRGMPEQPEHPARRNGKLQAALETQLERAAARSLGRATGPRRVGTDIVEITRVERAIAKWGDHFTSRAFTEAEIAYCESKHRPGRHYAGKLAAKEAVYKALGPGTDVPFSASMIEVVPAEDGDPVVRLTGQLAVWAEADADGPASVVVSISHAGDYAVAVAMV